MDDPARNPDDAYDVLKLNLVRDFQTGVYDYNTMVSLFVRSESFEPVKVAFASTEWCGGKLAGSARLEYWKIHGNGDERYLKELGLQGPAR